MEKKEKMEKKKKKEKEKQCNRLFRLLAPSQQEHLVPHPSQLRDQHLQTFIGVRKRSCKCFGVFIGGDECCRLRRHDSCNDRERRFWCCESLATVTLALRRGEM
jgi:hypothetical protein